MNIRAMDAPDGRIRIGLMDNSPFRASGLRWLYVDLNSYFASVEQQLRPALRGRPVIVIPADTEFTCAIAASYEAKGFGIRTGTPVREARKLCPGLTCVLARHKVYVDFHHLVLEEVDRHIPVASVCSIDEVACRLMSNESSPEAAAGVARAIKRGIGSNVGEYIRCSVGIAPNRYLAKVATDLQKPDGLTILQEENIAECLRHIALRDLPGIGPGMERRLSAAGVGDMQALLALTPKRMRSIWGNVWGERMWHLLRGADLPEPETERRTIGHSHVMAPELRHPDRARHVARRLLLKAASRLRRMEYLASRISFSARLEGGDRLKDQESCLPTQDSFVFLDLLERMWRRMRADFGALQVKKVSVTLHGLSGVNSSQELPFDLRSADSGPGQAGCGALFRAMDRLNLRFGRDMVLVGMLPDQGRSFSGTRIAFTRIPDREEFFE